MAAIATWKQSRKNMSERVGGDGFGDPGTTSDLANDPPGTVTVQPPPVCGQEQRAARYR